MENKKKVVLALLKQLQDMDKEADRLVNELEFAIESKTVSRAQETVSVMVNTVSDVMNLLFSNSYQFFSEIAWFLWETAHNEDGEYAVGYRKTETGTKKYCLKTLDDLWGWWEDNGAFKEGATSGKERRVAVTTPEGEELDEFTKHVIDNAVSKGTVEEYCAFCGEYGDYEDTPTHMSTCKSCGKPIVLCSTCNMEKCSGCTNACNWEGVSNA